MTTALQVKEVKFCGNKLMGARDINGIIWVGVRRICNDLGLSRGRINAQVDNIKSDTVLNRGCTKFRAGVFDPNNEALALQLDYLPLWLAKISITPAMKENNPALVEQLVEYQLKAKDVLARAFVTEYKERTVDDFIRNQMEFNEKQLEFNRNQLDFQKNQTEFNKMILDGFNNLQNAVGSSIATLATNQNELISVVKQAVSAVENVAINSQNNQQNVISMNQYKNNYSEWRKDVNNKIGFIATYRNVPSQVVFKELYIQMNSEYGHDLTRIQRAATINKGYGVTTISVVEADEELKRDFSYLLEDQVIECGMSKMLQESDVAKVTEKPIYIEETHSVKEVKAEPIEPATTETEVKSNRLRSTIKPLAIHLDDTTKGFNLTYRKVYKNMNVDWERRRNTYKNKYKLSNKPTKFNLVDRNDRLFTMFQNVVTGMLEAKNE